MRSREAVTGRTAGRRRGWLRGRPRAERALWWRRDSRFIDVESSMDGEIATIHVQEYGTALWVGRAAGSNRQSNCSSPSGPRGRGGAQRGRARRPFVCGRASRKTAQSPPSCSKAGSESGHRGRAILSAPPAVSSVSLAARVRTVGRLIVVGAEGPTDVHLIVGESTRLRVSTDIAARPIGVVDPLPSLSHGVTFLGRAPASRRGNL